MENKRVMIVSNSADNYLSKQMKKRGYYVEPMYKGNRFLITRLLRRLFIKYRLPFYKLWFNNRILKYDYDKMVITDALLSERLVKWICEKKDVETHIWYWNVASKSINPNRLKQYPVKIWTFSQSDAKKYNLNYTPPYFFSELTCNSKVYEYDILFVGKDKGRLDELLEYKKTFDEMGLKCKFIITPTKSYNKNKLYSKPVAYDETLKLGCQSKIILDLLIDDNTGQSLRMMEVLFRQQKIITNNKTVKEYDFYRKNNIFILGVDKLDDLDKFINSTYQKIPQDIIEKYDFDNFIKRLKK